MVRVKSALKAKAKKISAGETALVVYPPKSVREKIDKWRRQFDPNYRIIPPHITISYPFVHERSWPRNRSAIASAVAKFSPFRVSLRQTHYFDKKERVLWLKPEDGDKLTSMHASLRRKFPKHISSSGFSFVPHLTIGFFDSDRELREAWKIVSDAWKTVTFRVDRIYYIVHNQRGRWRVKNILTLKR